MSCRWEVNSPRDDCEPKHRELIGFAVLLGAVLVMLPIGWLAMSLAQLVLDDHAIATSVLVAL